MHSTVVGFSLPCPGEPDLNEAELDRLHGPAGLYIGSKTPAEIALSILAEGKAASEGLAGSGGLPSICAV